MTITKEILEKAKNGMKVLKNNNEMNAYISMEGKYSRDIDYIVERNNSYYCGVGTNRYVFWERSSYGFTFDESLFEEVK